MLHLKKESSRGEVGIILRGGERFFNGSLRTALTIAISIHIGAIVLFHVSPIKIRYSELTSPPVIVKAELIGDGDPTTVIPLEEKGERVRFHLKPPISSMTMPELNLPLMAQQSHPIREEFLAYDPLTEEEKIFFVADSVTSSTTLKDFELEIFGALADVAMVGDLPQSTPFSLLKEGVTKTQRLTLTVQVNAKTGKIFWYEEIGEDRISPLILKALEEITFQPNPNAFIYEGIIEITLRGELS